MFESADDRYKCEWCGRKYIVNEYEIITDDDIHAICSMECHRAYEQMLKDEGEIE